MAKQLVSKNTLLFKVGGTPDSANVITTSNYVGISPKAKSIEYNEIGNGVAGNNKVIINNDYVTADFSVEVMAKPSGSAGTPPTYADLFKCCGLLETIDTDNNKVTYTPNLTGATANATLYLDGYKKVASGIVGDLTFGGQVGEIAKFTFNLKGFTDLAETSEANPSVTLDANQNLVITSAQILTVGGGSIALEEFTFTLGNEIEEIYATNMKEFYISNFKPTIQVKAVKTKGNSDHWNDLNNNTQKAILITLGSGDGNIIELNIPYAQPNDANEDLSGKAVVYDETWMCQNSAGNDNFTFTFK